MASLWLVVDGTSAGENSSAYDAPTAVIRLWSAWNSSVSYFTSNLLLYRVPAGKRQKSKMVRPWKCCSVFHSVPLIFVLFCTGRLFANKYHKVIIVHLCIYVSMLTGFESKWYRTSYIMSPMCASAKICHFEEVRASRENTDIPGDGLFDACEYRVPCIDTNRVTEKVLLLQLSCISTAVCKTFTDIDDFFCPYNIL